MFLREWFVLPYQMIDTLKAESLIWGFPHVIVFDLDSTLITEEEHVRIRDDYVYESLERLQGMGCVLVLWSYGSKEHVAETLTDLKLTSYFDVIISEGSKFKYSNNNAFASSHVRTPQIIVDTKLNKQFVIEDFHYDIEETTTTTATPTTAAVNNNKQKLIDTRRSPNKYIPKSPKIVLKYLFDKNLNYIKSITLVDDLPSNNYAYDFYVKVKRCPVPVNDWDYYHDEIVTNITNYNYD
jgi:HAD superfamily phosphatase (TIGR01681 family)